LMNAMRQVEIGSGLNGCFPGCFGRSIFIHDIYLYKTFDEANIKIDK
jgi:hypothetical protein